MLSKHDESIKYELIIVNIENCDLFYYFSIACGVIRKRSDPPYHVYVRWSDLTLTFGFEQNFPSAERRSDPPTIWSRVFSFNFLHLHLGTYRQLSCVMFLEDFLEASCEGA